MLLNCEFPENAIPVKLLQPKNADSPILVTLSGIVMLFRLLQLENAESPILVTLSGIAISVSLLQPKNAEFPMLVTFLGRLIVVKTEQPAKALLSTLSIVSGNFTHSTDLLPLKASAPIMLTGKPAKDEGTVTYRSLPE